MLSLFFIFCSSVSPFYTDISYLIHYYRRMKKGKTLYVVANYGDNDEHVDMNIFENVPKILKLYYATKSSQIPIG